MTTELLCTYTTRVLRRDSQFLMEKPEAALDRFLAGKPLTG